MLIYAVPCSQHYMRYFVELHIPPPSEAKPVNLISIAATNSAGKSKWGKFANMRQVPDVGTLWDSGGLSFSDAHLHTHVKIYIYIHVFYSLYTIFI